MSHQRTQQQKSNQDRHRHTSILGQSTSLTRRSHASITAPPAIIQLNKDNIQCCDSIEIQRP